MRDTYTTDRCAGALIDLCEVDADWYRVCLIWVPRRHRGRGHARTMLARLLADADEERVTLALTVQPSAGSDVDHEGLTAWYRRHGFVEQAGEMVRRPRCDG